MVRLAGIHEYGVVIKPKKSQYLTVPVNPKAKGRKASEFNDLFSIKTDDGELFLVRNKGKDGIEFMYWLTKSVNIPKRPFLSTGHDENVDRVIEQTERAILQVLDGKKTVDDMLDLYGQQMATAIKKKIRNISQPPLSFATKETKGSTNPLKDTGGLIESITWKKE